MFQKINAYDLGRDRKKDFRLFLVAFALFALFGTLIQLCFGWYGTSNYVSTLLAFSYFKQGFMRRGLVGTLFDLLCRLVPAAQSYRGAFWFMWGMNAAYFFSLLAFLRCILSRIADKAVYRGAYFFSLICFAFLIPSACFQYGALGRADLLQIALCLLQIYLIVKNRHVWLTVPFTAVNVLFHEGYVLMTFCAVLIVILYRSLNTPQRKKYWLLFAAHILTLLVVTLLSLKGSGSHGSPEAYESARALAESLNSRGSIHWNLLAMMAGYRPEDAPVINDAAIVAKGLQELPFFLVTFIPAFLLFGRGFVQMFRQAKGKRLGTHITAMLLGPMLIGVEYVKFCDYGRYILWLVFYFLIVFLCFAAMDDEGAKGALQKAFGFSNGKALLVIAAMMVYQPLPTCSFTSISLLLRKLFYS